MRRVSVSIMERLTSRKNETIRRFRALGASRAEREERGEFLCDGNKLLEEALRAGAEITGALWAEEPSAELGCPQYRVPTELLDYVSPLKSAAGVVFTVRKMRWEPAPPGRTLVLETVQDPGNVGTILRTADALGADTVILTGDCADLYNPKTVRATMGAVFRQRCYEMGRSELRDYLTAHGCRLYGAALSPEAKDIRAVELRENAAVAVGSEGRGLSAELREMCDGELIIPMRERCESLNVAVAASILLWELAK